MARHALRIAFAAAAVLAARQALPAPAAVGPSIAVEGAQFRLLRPDGTATPQDALPGTILTLGDGSGRRRAIRIDAVERDSADPAGEIMLYTMSEQDPATHEWRNICRPDREGRRVGFPLPGAFASDMRHVDAPGRFLITCSGGAEGKCVRFGYKPWGRAPDGSSLEPYYQTCVRAVRADYCGDGVGHTRDGTPIDIFDRIGVQRDEVAPGITFEAAFGPDGATCVAHPRLPEDASLERLIALCPRLAAASGEKCTEQAAGLIFIRSFGSAPGP
jgi:hypothetical protein